MKRCSMCGQEKPEDQYWSAGKVKGMYAQCIDCCHDDGKWSFDNYLRLQRFSEAEQYIIDEVAMQPDTSNGLDTVYRRDPRRWHQLLAASVIKRREAQPA